MNKKVTDENRLPSWKILLILYVGILGTLVPGLIIMAVFGILDFFTSLKYVAGGLLLIVPVMWTATIIGNNIWDKFDPKNQEKIRNFGIGGILIVIFILYPIGLFGGQKWGGSGVINLFPESDGVKNYRVEADMKVESKFWWKKEYEISKVHWPNGGTTDFSDCVINENDDSCTDDEGKDWRVEVMEAPLSESSSADY